MEASVSFILFADIKGYGKLSSAELHRFHSNAMPLLAGRLRPHGWEYCNTWGDAIVIASKSARSIANMALDLRDFFQSYDWTTSELPRLDVRVSVHVGEHLVGTDPFTERGLIVGSTIILAARVEPVAMPGQIWVTEEARLAVQRVDETKPARFGFDDIGEVILPKGYPKQKLSLLRRSGDPALAAAERDQILTENLRRASAEKDSESKLAKSEFAVVVGIVLKNGKVEGVKDLLSRTTGGALVAGREHYFSSPDEMFAALGLNPHTTTIIRSSEEFTEDQLQEYFDNRNVDVEVPAWLPRRPLICQTIGDLDQADLESMFSAEGSEIAFWDHFMNVLCVRDARIHPSIEPDAIFRILIYLSRLTRSKSANVGPLSLAEIQRAFESAVGQAPVEEASVMLQRLFSLGRLGARSWRGVQLRGLQVG
jgi:hypothetical protein